jgi:hypothetical protein
MEDTSAGTVSGVDPDEYVQVTVCPDWVQSDGGAASATPVSGPSEASVAIAAARR